MTTRQRASSASSTDQYETEQQREWSQYTARVAIDFYGTRAYNRGDPVPVSAVEGDSAWINPEYVDKRDAFEGSTTVVSPEPPTIDPTHVAAPAAASPDVITTEG
jgi:hypothetical protein